MIDFETEMRLKVTSGIPIVQSSLLSLVLINILLLEFYTGLLKKTHFRYARFSWNALIGIPAGELAIGGREEIYELISAVFLGAYPPFIPGPELIVSVPGDPYEKILDKLPFCLGKDRKIKIGKINL